ncbi:MAG: ABC transporter permease [Patescibacteria group bacterium]
MNIANVFNRKNRILLKELVITDFKLRYQGSVLGYLWSLLKPLMLFAILYVVFVKFLRFGEGIEHYPVILLLGIVMWGFFTEATIQGMHSIIGRGDVIRKISFPKYIIVLSSTISALINLLINLAVVIIFMIINGVHFQASALLLPLNIIELYILALAIAFLLSALMVKYRDVVHVWEVVLQGLFYAVPIIYPLSLVVGFNETAAKIILLNPIAQIIQDARYNLISHQTTTVGNYINDPLTQLIPYVIILALIIFASIYFKNNSRYFAENL